MERNPVEVAVVNPDARVGDCSAVELMKEAARRADNARLHAASGEIKREYALAITHLEDAITRFNKGVYMQHGTFAISDAERAGT